jgi:tetratricopeptide (TPR) repeat protein
VQEVLDSAAGRIDAEFEAQPELRARLMHTMARVYKSLDLLPQAQALLEQVLVIRRPLLGDAHEDVLDALVALGHLHHMNQSPELARPLYEEVLKSTQEKFGDAHMETRKARSQLANVYESLGLDAAAEREYLAAIGPDDGSPASSSAEVLTIRSNLAALYLKLHRYEEAAVLLGQVYEGHCRNLGPDSEPALFTLTNLAGLYQATGRLEDAVRLASQVLDRRTIKDTANHPWTLQAALALGQLLLDSGRPDLAEPVLLKAFEGCRMVLPASHQQTLDSMRCLVRLRKAQGNLKAAATLAQELLDATPLDSPKRADYHALAESLLDSSRGSDVHDQEK